MSLKPRTVVLGEARADLVELAACDVAAEQAREHLRAFSSRPFETR